MLGHNPLILWKEIPLDSIFANELCSCFKRDPSLIVEFDDIDQVALRPSPLVSSSDKHHIEVAGPELDYLEAHIREALSVYSAKDVVANHSPFCVTGVKPVGLCLAILRVESAD